MVGTVFELAHARVRHLSERFLALQTTIDDLDRRVDSGPLERELERVVREAERTLGTLSQPDDLAASLEEALEARAAWERARASRESEDAAADRFTLALIELALRLRGRPRRSAARARV